MRQQIIEACAELLKETSSAAISTGEVARKAGCTQSLIYYYFNDEKELFCDAWLKIKEKSSSGRYYREITTREVFCSKSKVKEVL